MQNRIYTADIVSHEGQEIVLMGWVHARRDHGKLIFIDLRDRSGIVQIVFGPQIAGASDLRLEYVVKVSGTIKKRPPAMVNDKIPTGNYEIEAKSLEILSTSEPLPISINTDGYEINEEARLKYRYIDLRRERLQRNIKIRSEFINRIRQFLFGENFLEIETPLLTKSTPEGSRDFIVPSRMYPGKFFALPQSPQQYKQLLMIAGFERYFQIARCVRDEDLRSDRGFEHTQIDLEMSFVSREDVMALDEAMLIRVVEAMGYTIKEKPFPIFTHGEAMAKFGKDKFDVRNEEEKRENVLAFAWVIDFPFFEKDNNGNWTFTHNPFSHPKEEHIQWLLAGENIDKILTTQYDIICNGFEVGGGSIRAHKPEILKSVFRVLGYADDEIKKQFGHILEALTYGAPPHGGLAHGVDRLVMTLVGEEQYLREVQAFPQTSSGRTSVMNAPSEVDKKQLDELGLLINVKIKNQNEK